MKTAIQELIDDILSGKITEVLSNQQHYLDKEKQQIIDAVTHGNRSEFYDGSETIGEQYYLHKF